MPYNADLEDRLLSLREKGCPEIQSMRILRSEGIGWSLIVESAEALGFAEDVIDRFYGETP